MSLEPGSPYYDDRRASPEEMLNVSQGYLGQSKAYLEHGYRDGQVGRNGADLGQIDRTMHEVMLSNADFAHNRAEQKRVARDAGIPEGPKRGEFDAGHMMRAMLGSRAPKDVVDR